MGEVLRCQVWREVHGRDPLASAIVDAHISGVDVGASRLCRRKHVERSPDRAHLPGRSEQEVEAERAPFAKEPSNACGPVAFD